MGPLGVPDLRRFPAPADVARSAAVRLFLQRARDVAPGFALTRSNAAAVAAICRRRTACRSALELGSLARTEGRDNEARALLHGALRRIHLRGEGALLRSAVCLIGLLEIARGEAARGVTILATGAGGAGPIGTVHMPAVRAEAPGFLEQARQTLGEAGYAAAWAAGRTLSLEEAVAYALEDAPAAA